MTVGIFVRKLARYSSILSLAVLVYLASINDILPWQMGKYQLALFLLYPVGVIAGLAISWKYEGLGGLFAIVCTVLFYVFFQMTNGMYPQQNQYILLALPGVAFVLSALLNDPSY